MHARGGFKEHAIAVPRGQTLLQLISKSPVNTDCQGHVPERHVASACWFASLGMNKHPSIKAPGARCDKRCEENLAIHVSIQIMHMDIEISCYVFGLLSVECPSQLHLLYREAVNPSDN
jgi:hypothetical protein